MSEDITFCDNQKCKVTRCFRNPKNIKHFEIPHSFASLEGSDMCPSFEKAAKEIKNERETFEMLVQILTDEQLKELHKNGLFTDDFGFILITEMYKRCLI